MEQQESADISDCPATTPGAKTFIILIKISELFSATTKTFMMFMLQKTQKSAGLSDWEPLLIHKTQSLKNFYFLISQNMLLSSLLSAFPFLHEGYIAKQVVDGKGKDWLASKQRRVTVGQKQQRLPLVTLAASPYPLALSS